MLSMNGILVVELLLGAALMGLIFMLFPNTDLITPSAKSKRTVEPEGGECATEPVPARIDLTPDGHERLSNRLVAKNDVGSSASSGK